MLTGKLWEEKCILSVLCEINTTAPIVYYKSLCLQLNDQGLSQLHALIAFKTAELGKRDGKSVSVAKVSGKPGICLSC